MIAVAAACGQKRARSAMPPEMIAGIAAAKVRRKKNFTRSRPCGANSTPSIVSAPLNTAALTKTVTVTITGRNDRPEIEVGTGTVTEFEDRTLSFASNWVRGTLSFTDADLNDVGHTANVVSVSRSGETDGLPSGLVGNLAVYSWLDIESVTKASGSTSGAVNWRFSAADTFFDYLTKDQSVTLTYTVRLNDGDGGQRDTTVTITVQGSNDRPVFLGGGVGFGVETVGATGSTDLQTASGTLLFGDADRDDVGHTAQVAYSGATGTTAGLDASRIEGALALGSVAKAANSVSGTIGWTFAAEDGAFDYLGAGAAWWSTRPAAPAAAARGRGSHPRAPRRRPSASPGRPR